MRRWRSEGIDAILQVVYFHLYSFILFYIIVFLSDSLMIVISFLRRSIFVNVVVLKLRSVIGIPSFRVQESYLKDMWCERNTTLILAKNPSHLPPEATPRP